MRMYCCLCAQPRDCVPARTATGRPVQPYVAVVQPRAVGHPSYTSSHTPYDYMALEMPLLSPPQAPHPTRVPVNEGSVGLIADFPPSHCAGPCWTTYAPTTHSHRHHLQICACCPTCSTPLARSRTSTVSFSSRACHSACSLSMP